MKRNFFATTALILVSITSTYFVTRETTAQQPVVADNDYQIGGTLYMQTAAEYRALCYQAFNSATDYLDIDEKLKKKLPKVERKKPRAVVVDIDETMLDNSPAQAAGIKNKSTFNLQNWYAWGEMRKAKAIPGAVDFAKEAKEENVRIFYVSNRDEVQKLATIDNLIAVGFPDVSAENVILRQKDSSKESRRLAIAEKYRIIMLIGDNLNDHAMQFERKSIAERFAETDKARELWGKKYIVLPNAMYGEWENAIYDYKRLTEDEKSAKRKEMLQLP
jgi:5'-nucleotidase (lipoprotein e(P4) family)